MEQSDEIHRHIDDIYRRNANASVQCPVQPGEYTLQQTVALPKEIPQGEQIYAAEIAE